MGSRWHSPGLPVAGVCRGEPFPSAWPLFTSGTFHFPSQDPASPSLSLLQLVRMVMWGCEILLLWTSFLQMNPLSDAYVQHQHSLTRTLPRNVSSSLSHTAADWVVLHGTWGKKGVSRNSQPPLPAGFQRKAPRSSQRCSQQYPSL